MGNLCDNELKVSGPPESVERFCSQFTEKGFCGVVPEPDFPEVGKERLRWRLKHWGNEWNVHEDDIFYRKVDGAAIFKFETTWTPPIPWLDEVGRAYPDLQLTLVYVAQGGRNFGIAEITGERPDDEPCEDDYDYFRSTTVDLPNSVLRCTESSTAL